MKEEKLTMTLPVIDSEKFIFEWEKAVNVFKSGGVDPKDILVCVSNVFRAAIRACMEDQFKLSNGGKFTMGRSRFTLFGVTLPRGNYPYNDKVILFTDESCMNGSPVIEIHYSDLILE